MKSDKIIISILIFTLLIFVGTCVNATTIDFSNNSPNVGQSVKITVSVPNVHTATVYANVSGAGTSGQIKVVGGDMMGNKTTLSNSITVTPTSAGTITVSVTSNSSAVADGAYVNVSASKSITVKQPAPPPTTPAPEPTTPTTPTEPTKPVEPVVSSNANLSNLGIRPNDFSGFRASKTSYEVTVPNEVSQIEIYATAQDEKKATISGRGMKTLQEGTNVFKIIVTAENGKTKTYKLNVIRQVAGSEIVPNSGDDISDSTSELITMGLSKLELKGFKFEPEFSVDTYRYTIELEDEEIITLEQIKELIVAEVNFEGGTFEITGDEKLEKEENEVVISVKDADGREIAIYTLVFKYPKVEDTANTADTSDTAMLITTIDEPFEIDIDKLIILLSITIITIIAIISTINSYKQRKILKENGLIKEKQVYDEDEEEIIEESEEQVVESEVEQKEENKDYIEDIFKTSQMSFEADDKDFIKKKRGKGKHS